MDPGAGAVYLETDSDHDETGSPQRTVHGATPVPLFLWAFHDGTKSFLDFTAGQYERYSGIWPISEPDHAGILYQTSKYGPDDQYNGSEQDRWVWQSKGEAELCAA